MRKVILVYTDDKKDIYSNLLKQIESVFREEQIELEHLCIGQGAVKRQDLNMLIAKDMNYICTLDMAGFQLDTLLDLPVYNISTAKQMHIVVDEEVMSWYGEYEMALNVFLFLPGDIEPWRERYSHIPSLNVYSGFEFDEDEVPTESAHNLAVLREIIYKVIQETEG